MGTKKKDMLFFGWIFFLLFGNTCHVLLSYLKGYQHKNKNQKGLNIYDINMADKRNMEIIP